MIIEKKKKEKTWGYTLRIECDFCHKEFERTYQKYYVQKKHHFCSRKCHHNAMKSGNIWRCE
jgi:hypothetical protein